MKGTIEKLERHIGEKSGKPWFSLTINGEEITTFDKKAGALSPGDTIEYNTHKSGKWTNLSDGWKKVTELKSNEQSMIAMNALKSAVTLAAATLSQGLTPDEAADFAVKCFLRFHKGLLQTLSNGAEAEPEEPPEPDEPEPKAKKTIKGESGKVYAEPE